jgi:hypothetical protein
LLACEGGPEIVAFLYHHYNYLHPDVQRQVFLAIWERLSCSQDQAPAMRLRTLGMKVLLVTSRN